MGRVANLSSYSTRGENHELVDVSNKKRKRDEKVSWRKSMTLRWAAAQYQSMIQRIAN
jgi:hypothetical protein